MAVRGLSRATFVNVVAHNALGGRVASSSRLPGALAYAAARSYATTASPTVTHKKGAAPSKKAQKHAAGVVAAPVKKQKHVPTKKVAPAPVETAADLHQELSDVDKLKELEKMLAMSELMPTVDPWGQVIQETLDVMIPYESFKEKGLQKFTHNFANGLKNNNALKTLMQANSVHGKHYSPLPKSRFRTPGERWERLRASFRTRSVDDRDPMGPFRAEALQMYLTLNHALASRNENDILKLTTFSYQEEMFKRLKSANKIAKRMIWNLHSTVSPVQVVSLRVTEGYMAETPPRFGNRLLIHALVKFDTEQSLEIYNDRGMPLHTRGEDTEFSADEKWRVPAQKKRVTEYLVLERRKWIEGPWQFREQMWPTEL